MKVDRRDFLKMSVAAGSVALLGARAVASETGGEVRRLETGPHLFLDDDLVAEQTGLRRVIEPPERLPEPIIKADPDKCFQPYVSVLRDPQSRRFRMWYNSAVSSSQSHIAYMESEDGIHFIRPHRDLEDPGGLPVGFGAYVVDDGPGATDPSRRYKLAWEKDGLFTAFSPDGLTWTPATRERVLGGIGDIIALSRDPYRKRYLLTCKVNARPEDGYKGSTPNAAEGTRRLVGQSTSDDCVHWSPATRIIAADEKDEGVTEFYSIGQVIARGGLLIGPLKVLRDDLPSEPKGEVHGIGYTVLAWTRDGQTWHRDREPFMDRNAQPGSWDRAMTWGDCFLPVEDDVFIYYGGYARGHKVERFKERQIGFARMKQDRFIARSATASGGTLRTPVVTMDAATMTVNANVKGSLRAALLDPSGKPISGYSAEDCTSIHGDSLSHEIRWKQPLAALRGRPLRLELNLADASLYALEVRT